MRAIKWTLFNGAICACAWFGYVEGNKYYSNIFAFFSCFALFFGVLSFFVSSKSKDELKKKGRSVTSFISGMSDLFLIVICAAYGHWLFASAWAVSMLSEALVYGEEK